MPDILLTLEPGDTPGNPPQTPPEHKAKARIHFELLLRGWERAVAEAEHLSQRDREIVGETIDRMKAAFEAGTSVHNLIATVLTSPFLLPGELDVIGMTEETAIVIGIDIEQARAMSRLSPSVFRSY